MIAGNLLALFGGILATVWMGFCTRLDTPNFGTIVGARGSALTGRRGLLLSVSYGKRPRPGYMQNCGHERSGLHSTMLRPTGCSVVTSVCAREEGKRGSARRCG